MKKTMIWMVESGVAGVLLIVALFAALMVLFAGCRVVEVENRGEGVLVGTDGAPVLVDGKLVRYSKGWNVYHNQHWMATEADTLEASIRSNEISFALGKLNTKPSEELAKLVDVSLKGAAELAAKIGAAIASSGGSVAGEAAYSALEQKIKSYLAKGGSAEKATVTCNGKDCTISDGTVEEVCEDCALPGWVE